MNMTPSTSPCKLLIVTVNYRTPALTVNCLRAVAPEVSLVPGTRAVVVDNASGDDSVATIQTAITAAGWEAWATVIASDQNGGYAYGNNWAIRPALQQPNPPDYVLLLNSDTQVRPSAIKSLVDYLDEHPKVGIAGSAMENPDGSIWSIGFRFPSILSELESGLLLGFVSKLLAPWAVPQRLGDRPQPIDWLPGASMIIRRAVFESVGLMDEGYFLYYEETDFCLQAQRAGWSCWYVPESQVMHIAGQSTGVTDRAAAPKRLPQYVFESRRRYFLKNHGFLYAAFTDIVWSLSYLAWSGRRVLQRKPDNDPPYLFFDSLRNSVLWKALKGQTR
jgi:N-acetylglucosaminyl-diphospho-decaprenol L-rhamnosyltransferase